MKRKKERRRTGFFALILCWMMLLGGSARAQEPEPFSSQLYAHSAVLMDGDSGRILYGKNEDEVLPMASTTKIMTCILALELADKEEVCQVSANAQAQPKVHVGMREGETYYLGDLLYSMMLESHNDSAVCVAEHVGGSVEEFARLMNEKAFQIGCENTHYVTPNGLDGEDGGGVHATTAADLARVMRYCVMESEKREEFLAITQTPSYSFQEISGARSVSCVNHNTLLTLEEGTLSGKTGFTAKAGYCYVGAVHRDGKTLIGALLACGWPNNKGYKWSDMGKILDYGFETYDRKAIDLTGVDLPAVQVSGGVDWQAGLTVDLEEAAAIWGTWQENQEGKILLPLLAGAGEEIRLELQAEKNVSAPLCAGEEAGEIICRVEGQRLASFPVYYAENVEEIHFGYCLERIIQAFLSMGGERGAAP